MFGLLSSDLLPRRANQHQRSRHQQHQQDGEEDEDLRYVSGTAVPPARHQLTVFLTAALCVRSAAVCRHLSVQHGAVQVSGGHRGVRVSPSPPSSPQRRHRLLFLINVTVCPQWRRGSQFNFLQSFHAHSVSGQQPRETRPRSGWETEARGHQPGLQHAVSPTTSEHSVPLLSKIP